MEPFPTLKTLQFNAKDVVLLIGSGQIGAGVYSLLLTALLACKMSLSRLRAFNSSEAIVKDFDKSRRPHGLQQVCDPVVWSNAAAKRARC